MNLDGASCHVRSKTQPFRPQLKHSNSASPLCPTTGTLFDSPTRLAKDDNSLQIEAGSMELGITVSPIRNDTGILAARAETRRLAAISPKQRTPKVTTTGGKVNDRETERQNARKTSAALIRAKSDHVPLISNTARKQRPSKSSPTKYSRSPEKRSSKVRRSSINNSATLTELAAPISPEKSSEDKDEQSTKSDKADAPWMRRLASASNKSDPGAQPAVKQQEPIESQTPPELTPKPSEPVKSSAKPEGTRRTSTKIRRQHLSTETDSNSLLDKASSHQSPSKDTTDKSTDASSGRRSSQRKSKRSSRRDATTKAAANTAAAAADDSTSAADASEEITWSRKPSTESESKPSSSSSSSKHRHSSSSRRRKSEVDSEDRIKSSSASEGKKRTEHGTSEGTDSPERKKSSRRSSTRKHHKPSSSSSPQKSSSRSSRSRSSTSQGPTASEASEGSGELENAPEDSCMETSSSSCQQRKTVQRMKSMDLNSVFMPEPPSSQLAHASNKSFEASAFEFKEIEPVGRKIRGLLGAFGSKK